MKRSRFTFKYLQIMLSQDTLPYYISKSLKIDGVLFQSMRKIQKS